MLTTAQKATLNTSINANAAAYPAAIDQHDGPVIAAFFNAIASPDFMVWRTEVPVNDIFDAISWDKFTPTDAVDNTVTYTNRLMLVNVKQMNLQNMLLGRATIDASKANIRLSLRDAVVNVPTGVSGANVQAAGASGVTLINTLLRKATVAEKLFTTGSAVTGGVTGNLMGHEGPLSGSDILAAMGW